MSDLEMIRLCAELCGLDYFCDGDSVYPRSATQMLPPADKFDPLTSNADAFTVLAKLRERFSIVIDRSGFVSASEDTPTGLFMSQTIVTDESTLRRAICEIGAQVGEAG